MKTVQDLGRCFVTGGAGFLGSHLVDRLLAEGNFVCVYDNLSSGSKRWIEPHVDNPRFTFIQADLLDAEALDKAIAGHDLVFHLAANTDIRGGKADPRIDLENCTIATYNVLEAIRTTGINRIVFTSSAVVLGEAGVYPTPESYGPLLPISLYGAGKLAGEALISSYCHLFNMQAWIFRIGNVVGARMGFGILHDFIAKLRQDRTQLEILGDGKQEKSHFLVGDCIDGMLFALQKANEKPCDVFNVGCDSTITVSEIARITVEEMGLGDVTFHYTGDRQGWPGDVPTVVLDVSKMTRLGWRASHTSAEAVRIAVRQLLGKE
jgi:UDP-glucose 4-epimerase